MAVPLSDSAIWEEIERSESYLVCCMFEEAISLSSSVLRRICGADSAELIEKTQLADMMESAGMVLVQSLKELRRTSEILNELKVLFGSVTAIPIQVFLTGTCIQVSEGSYSGLTEFLDEFLGKWRYVNGQSYILAGGEANGPYLKGSDGLSILEIEKYFEVAEVYAVALLKTGLKYVDPVITCVKKAELPDGKEKELVRRLQSLCSCNATNLSEGIEKPKLGNENTAHADSHSESTKSGVQETAATLKARCPPKSEDITGKAILSYTKRVEPCFWWYRSVTLKFGNACLSISRGKILLWCSSIFVYYVLHKKRAILKRNASRLALSVKKALVDMWQLAFSVQVNPLAAVQPLPAANRGTR